MFGGYKDSLDELGGVIKSPGSGVLSMQSLGLSLGGDSEVNGHFLLEFVSKLALG